MRYFQFLIMLFFLSASNAQSNADSLVQRNKAQVQLDDEPKIFTKTEIAPSYPNGEKKLFLYIEENLDKPTLLAKGATKGDYGVVIRFIIKMDGTAYDFKPETQNGFGLEDEIIRILKTVPKWEPAKQNSRKVYAYHRVKITVNL